MPTLAQIQPVADRVVIRRDKLPQMTNGGLYVPGSAKNNQNHGIVVKAGPDSSLTADDKIYFQPGSGMKIDVEGEDLFIMAELGVIAVK